MSNLVTEPFVVCITSEEYEENNDCPAQVAKLLVDKLPKNNGWPVDRLRHDEFWVMDIAKESLQGRRDVFIHVCPLHTPDLVHRRTTWSGVVAEIWRGCLILNGVKELEAFLWAGNLRLPRRRTPKPRKPNLP